MSWLSSAYESLKDVATNKKDLFNKNSVMGKLDVGSFRQLHRLTGDPTERLDQLRRYGHMGTGAVAGAASGLVTGGPYGAVAGAIGGGVRGYQDDRAVTGKRALKDVGEGAAIGTALGSGAGYLTGQGAVGGMTAGSSAPSTVASTPSSGFSMNTISNLMGSMPSSAEETTPTDNAMEEIRKRLLLKQAMNKAYREKLGGNYAI